MSSNDDAQLFIGFAVADSPTPLVPSDKRECSSCGQALWVDCNVVEFADTCRIVCLSCVSDEIEGRDIDLRVHPNQLGSIEGYLRRN